jgi:uncharacterized protein
MHCIYLHGFASGPRSEKAMFFASRLRNSGYTVHVPDLNEPEFAGFTLSRQIAAGREVAQRLGSQTPIILLGSSMGGLAATILAQELRNLQAMVLFAPGYGINKRFHIIPGPQALEAWRVTGYHEVFHDVYQQLCPLQYTFIADFEKHQTDGLKTIVPTLLFHGVGDEVIPIQESRRFSRDNIEFVEYHEFDSDHNLLNVLDPMWRLTDRFLAREAASLLPA